MSTDQHFFSAAEVADYLGVHEKQIYRLMKKGGLPGTRVTGKWLFPKVLVDRYILESAGGRAEGARAVVVAGDDDPVFDSIANAWSAVGEQAVMARVPCPMERGLLLLARGVVDGVVIEHAADGCRGSIDRRLRRSLGSVVDERGLVRVRLGRREVGVVGRRRLDLQALVDRRVSVREAGVASRTLAEHQLLRAGADPTLLTRQPTAHNHRAAVEQVLVDEVDGAVVPVAEGRALGLQATTLATLELSLLVTRAVAERELKHLGLVIAGAVRAALTRAEIDVDGAGTITAVA